MIDRGEYVVRRWSRLIFLTSVVVGGLVLAVKEVAIAGADAAPDRAAITLIAEDAGWLPGETPVPGNFPGPPAVDFQEQKYHYVDAQGVKRTSVLVYMDPGISKRATQRNEVRTFAAKKGGIVRYEYDTVMPGVLNTTAPFGHGLSRRHEGKSSILMPFAVSVASVFLR